LESQNRLIGIESSSQAIIGNFQREGTKDMSDKIAAKKCWVLIEGPAPGDADFLGRWLLAAAEADKLLQEQYEQDPSFKLTISRLELVYAFAFSPAATKSIELLIKDLTSFSPSRLRHWCDAAIHEGKAGRARPHGKKTSFAFTAFIMASSPGRLSLPLAPLMLAS
jgi:hypothetical protein